LKKLQCAVTLLVACSASGSAVTVVGPIAPHAVLTVVAMASAIRELLGSLVFASLPAMLRHFLNVAIASFLTTALVASSPRSPVAPQAVDNLLPQSARVCATWDGLTNGFVAWSSTRLRLRVNSPHAGLLTSSAFGRAIGPLLPISEFAILGWFSSASFRWTFAGFGIALINLLGGTKAPLSLATSVFGNTSGATLHSVTSTRAVTPSTPISKLAVCILGT